MKAQWLALITAVAWGVGGYFEKKGLHAGQLPPQVGITVRTAVALVVLGVASFPQWKTLGQAGAKPLLSLAVGGGLVAGSLGMLCFYAALKKAPLGVVMPIAFTSPLFGALVGAALGGETLSPRTLLGMLMTVGGIALIAIR
jgi:bacterial/archaeal transporter family protein